MIAARAVAAIVAAQIKASIRDPREPGRERKAKRDKQLELALRAYFLRLADKVRRHVETLPKASKAIPDYYYFDDFADDEIERELILILLDAAQDGTRLAAETAKIAVDYNLTNKEAAAWVRKYVTPFLKDLNQATRDNINATIKLFIETPGMTVKDTIDALKFDDPARAKRIAVTETTRAYAEGNLEYGAQLKEEFPDVRVTKTWYTTRNTSEPGAVCDICRPLEGKEVDFDEYFDAELEINAPPAHPNCYCWLDVRTRI